MLKPILVANSLSITVFIVRSVFVIKGLIVPEIFAWWHKAMMMGQNTAFVHPTPQEGVIVTVVPTLMAWVIGYFFATVYNYLAKRK